MSLGTSDTKFSAALGKDKRISVAGTVKGSQSYLTRVGTFDVDLSLSGIILLVRVFLCEHGTSCMCACDVGFSFAGQHAAVCKDPLCMCMAYREGPHAWCKVVLGACSDVCNSVCETWLAAWHYVAHL